MISDMVAAVFAITPNWKQREPPLITKWDVRYFQAMEYSLAIKIISQPQLYATGWLNLVNITPATWLNRKKCIFFLWKVLKHTN